MTRRDLALHLLREAGERGVTTAELLQAGVGSRYGGRILELRKQGFVIETTRERQSSFRYRLVSGPQTGGWGDPPLHAPHVGGSAQDSGTALAPSASVMDRLFEPPSEPHWRAA